MTQTNLSDGSSVIYVRVPNSDKELLRSLADREFDGSMSKCIRYLLNTHAAGKARRPPARSPKRRER